jgi:hypothetical protein
MNCPLPSIRILYIIDVYISIIIARDTLVSTKLLKSRSDRRREIQSGEEHLSLQDDSKGGRFLPASCPLRVSSATLLCGPVPARNADLKAARGPAPTRPQAVSPIFRAALVQTSAALRPFHSALLRYKGGDTPQLALATPRLRQVAFGIWLKCRRPNPKQGATTMTTKKQTAGFQTLALSGIHESTTNPRRTFDESKLAELADFVSGHKIGVLCR